MSTVLAADSTEARERFHACLDLVDIIARQISKRLSTLVELDELMSSGREGLLDAARRFDASRGVPFRSYANFRIQGAIYDGLRRSTGLPRRARERILALEAASLVSEGEAEHSSARQGAAEELGRAEKFLANHLSAMATAAAIRITTSRSASADHADALVDARDDPEQAFARAELLDVVRREVDGLPKDEAEVVRRMYFEGQRLEDVARDHGVSLSWASRLHTRAVARLCKRMKRSH
jgi:RNA polymerase sigma factor for flagellar operon FliA